MKDMAKRGMVGLLTVSMCLSHVQGIAFADSRVEVGEVEVDGHKITLSLRGDSIMDAAKAAFEDAHLYENEYLGVSRDAKTQAAYRALTDGTNPLYEMNLFSEEEMQALEDAGVEVKALIQMDQEQAEAEGNLKPATESNALRATEEENTQLVVFDPKKEGKQDLLLYKQDSLFANFYDQFSNQLMNQTTTEITAADPASYEINGDEKVTFILINHADDTRVLNLKLNDATLEKSIKLPKAETVIKGVMHTLDEKGIDDTTEPASPSVVPTQEATTADSTTAEANASTEASTEAASTTDATEANAETQLPAESETTAAATETLPQEGQIESENIKSEATEAAPEHKTLAETVKENLAQVVENVKETITAVEETLGVIHSEAAENEGFATESELEKETTAAAAEEKKESTKIEMDTALENERKDLLKNTKASELVDSSVASAKVLQYTLDDLSKAYWSAEIEGEYEVNVFAEKTAFDADDQVKLQLKKLDKPEEAEDGTLATTDDTLSKEQVDALRADGSYENSQSIDIRFVDEDGKEVEPKTPVKVKIKVYKEALPEDADISTMTIKHLDESNGNVQAATVASYGETANGAIKAVDEQGKKVELKSVDADTAEVADEEVKAASVATAATKEVLPEEAVGVESTFTVNSFSSFTITFGSKYYTGTLTIKYVDPKYRELDYVMPDNWSQVSVIDFDNKDTFGKDIKKEIKKKVGNDTKTYDIRTYELYNVKIVRPWENKENGQTIERRLVKINDTTILGNPKIRWQYTIQNGDTRDFESGDTIYVMYKEKLEEVETVPMPSGFHLYMENYRDRANVGCNDYSPNARPGLYSSVIPEGQEYPTLNWKSGESLSQYYEHAVPVDRLFVEQKEGSQNEGYLYYNCEENFATLGEDGNFHVYKQLGTPSYEDQWYFHRGNFMPYNHLDTTKIWNTNRNKTHENEKIPPEDPRYDENLYGFTEVNQYDGNMDGFYFGAYGKADFYQPKNGLVNGKPMVYEFIGDDDLVVYIDGVLALDLGGIHDALSGSINFATGKIKCTGNESNNNANLFDILSKSELKVGMKDGKVDNDFWKKIITDDGKETYVFQDNSKHSIKFFYMERGAGASNLKLKINIPPTPDGSLNIIKNVEGLNKDQSKNEKFYFRLFDKDGNDISVPSYTVDGKPRKAENGLIWIYDGERAQITGLTAEQDVKVREVNTRNIYTTQCESTDSKGQRQTSNNNEITVKIPSADSIEVKVTNTVKSECAKKLTVKKNFNVNDDISSDPDKSLKGGKYNNIEFILKEKTVDDKTGAVKYTPVGDPVRFENFKPNENNTSAYYKYYEFENLDSTKTYVVEENRAKAELYGGTEDKPYSKTGYQIDETGTNGNITWDDSNPSSTSTVDFRLTNDKTVTFTNVYQTPSVNVQFKKVDSKTSEKLNGAEFEVTKDEQKITLKDDKGNILIDDGKLAITGGVKELELSNGVYELTETKAPDGYNLLTKKIKFTISDGTVTLNEGNDMSSISEEKGKFVVTIKNEHGVALPVTGGTGTILFSLGGMALMLIALGYVVMKRREEGVVIK